MDVLQPVTPICVRYDSDAKSITSEKTASTVSSKGKKKSGKIKLLKSKSGKKKRSLKSRESNTTLSDGSESKNTRSSFFDFTSQWPNCSCSFIPKVSDFFYSKYYNSKIYEFYHGTCLVEDVDVSMNTAIFINGILLGIPFGLSTSMSYDYWDWLKSSVYTCLSGEVHSDDAKAKFLRYMELEIKSSLSASLFSATIGVLLSIIYFLFRPREALRFYSWFKRAKYAITLIFIISALSVISVFISAAMNIKYYNQSSDSICFELRKLFKNNGKSHCYYNKNNYNILTISCL